MVSSLVSCVVRNGFRPSTVVGFRYLVVVFSTKPPKSGQLFAGGALQQPSVFFWCPFKIQFDAQRCTGCEECFKSGDVEMLKQAGSNLGSLPSGSFLGFLA